MINYWAYIGISGLVFATILYFVALRVQVMALVDVVWSAWLGVGALAYFCMSPDWGLKHIMVLVVILFWSLRLSLYLLVNRVLAGHEDPRYAYLSNYWGATSKRNFLFLFHAQIVLVLVFLLPVITAMGQGTMAWAISDTLAVCVALVSLIGESIADRQLARFRVAPENQGAVCQSGLWNYSRHPNYFFEWLHWWSYVLFAWGHPQWAVSLIGPLVMYLFLNYITGVPYAERSSIRSRGNAYRVYQQTTNTFFPWKPRALKT